MIEPQDQHRFDGDSGIDIASCAIDVRFPDGKKTRVLLRLGAPFKKEDQWWIRTELENLYSTNGPIAGDGALHTLILGIMWLILQLESFEEKQGCRYFYPDSEEYFDHRSVLATRK
jgi:hypothetical protein